LQIQLGKQGGVMAQSVSEEQEGVVQKPSSQGADWLNKPWVRAMVAGLIVAVCLILVVEVRSLWGEFAMLRVEENGAELSQFIGYSEISPRLSLAQRPDEWHRREGQSLLLWDKWVDGVGHHWFRLAPDDINLAGLVVLQDKFIARPIDEPIIETGGGKIWQRIPSQAQVVGHVLADRQCAYPVLVLLKVQVINDVVGDQPFLVTANVLAQPSEAFSIYDASLDGRRVTMATSWYFQDRKPVLYDRGTESLWIEQEQGLTSIAGRSKGKTLSRVARPVPIAWHTWRLSNPRSRLVVGADRTKPLPTD
jgi:hypothetical protein